MTFNGKELRLLKPEKKSLLRIIFGRTGIITLLMLAQVVLLMELPSLLSVHFPLLFNLLNGAAATVVGLHIINTDDEPTLKLTWLGIVMLLPLFGTLLYAYIRSDLGHRVIKSRVQSLMDMTRECLHTEEQVREELKQGDASLLQLENYLERTGCYPVYKNTKVTYYPLGDQAFTAMVEQLEKAEHFIFLEYFIVEEGHMWGQILEILARKASEGLEVRLMYDGTCEFSNLPHDYPKRLAALGIQCRVFSAIQPFVSTHYNYRDHRKILVIDGQVAFNGGINLADEYINHVPRFGYWKDTAVMLRGDAVRSFTLMFLQVWCLDEKAPDFTPHLACTVPQAAQTGFVIPYGDCPLDSDKVGERVYMDLLNRAQRYVHIMTPYLILDGELETALKFAAERGVEVMLILPGVPDKKIPYALAKTYYASLMASGVKILEFTPGFIHAKSFVVDDTEAVVGTINLDYRSLYHHFECATYLVGTDCTQAIEADFQETAALCRPVTRQSLRQEKLTTKLTGVLTKVIAPLL